MGGQADEDAGFAVGQRRGRDTGMFDRMPCRFHQQPMLRVDPSRLARRHPEERCVEAVHIVDESAPAGDDLPGRGRIRVEEFVGIPPALGHFRDRIPGLLQHLPVLVGIGCTGQPGRVADDRETRCARRRVVSSRH